MKYQVQISYTNPAHDHVTLRRRVETITRLVEASTEGEALNRAANQQRALGFIIREAKVIESDAKKEKEQLEEVQLNEEVEQVKEGAKEDAAELLGGPVKTKPKMPPGKRSPGSRYVRGLARKAMKAGMKKEEVDQVDEANTKMTDAHKKVAREVHRELKSGDQQVSQVHGDRIRNMHSLLRRKYGSNWRTLAGINEEVEQVDEAKLNQVATFVPLKKHIENKSLRNAIHIPVNFVHGDKSHKEKLVKKVGAEKAAMYKLHGVFPRKLGEEAEQVDEANMRFDPEAAARPKSSDVKNFLNRDKNARAGAASKKYIRRMTKLGGLGPNQTKKDTEKHMKDYFEEVEISEASKEGKSVMYGMRASMKAMDLRHGVDSDKRDSGYKMSPAVRAAQAKSDALSKVEKPVQAGTLAALKRRAMKKEEVESVDEGVISAVKNAQAKWKTAHRAVYGKDPSLKSMTVGAIARLAGAKASTARAVGAAVGGKPVSAQQQAAAKARAGKVGMAKMRNEEKHEGDDVNANVKGKKAAEKMTKKAAEVRKAKIQGSVNKINMEPTIDLNKKAEK